MVSQIIAELSTLNVEQWKESYLPIANHIDIDASWQNSDSEGTMFETFGAELDFVLSQPNNKVWTFVEGDRGTYLIPGYRTVNRLGYFICEKAWNDTSLEVLVNDYFQEE